MGVKTTVVVPKGIRFFSEWAEYPEKYLLNEPHILDKEIPGCGFTEWCLRNNLSTIWSTPRKSLLWNKLDQHPGEVYYAKNELDDTLEVDKDTTAKINPANYASIEPNAAEESIKDAKRQEQYRRLQAEITDWCKKCRDEGRPIKIMVTYDSYYLVKDILIGLGIFDSFYNVIDEFQSIFMDSVFKSDTEMKLLKALQGVQKVVYVSATPMLSQYLQMIPEFKDLPIIELDWKTADPNRICKPMLFIKKSNSITTSIKPEIEKYKEWKFPIKYVPDPNTGAITTHVSNEMVIYVNSVTNIINIIKKCKLQSNECNILCADTKENRARITKKLGKTFSIGRVLTMDDLNRGMKQKMFTFCTRTVYIGSDFYSTCAKTYILSDANIGCITIDISLDLPQILGRQRLDENPWRNEADFYYTLPSRNTKENALYIQQNIQNKLKDTESLMRTYGGTPDMDKYTLAKLYRKSAKAFNYVDNYVAVNVEKIYDQNTGNVFYKLVPAVNNLVIISDQRALDLQQYDYKDRFSVFNSVNSVFGNDEAAEKATKFMDEYNGLTDTRDKLKLLCESKLTEEERQSLVYNQLNGTTIGRYYIEFGLEGLKSCSYNVSRITKKLHEIGKFNSSELKDLIVGYFQVGEFYSYERIKNDLQDLYQRCGYNQIAKATDLKSYFEVKILKISDGKGGRINGYKIVKLI